MKFRIQREVFLQPLSQVVGVVERRQTLPVLANFLIVARDGTLSVTGTDMEVELVGSVAADITQEGEITLPARKLVDIVKALPDGSTIDVAIQDEKATMLAGKSRYTLATLPASEFPATDQVETNDEIVISEKDLKRLIDKTAFAMANQDVRYYLNGMLFDLRDGQLRLVATDGHRLAVSDRSTVPGPVPETQSPVRAAARESNARDIPYVCHGSGAPVRSITSALQVPPRRTSPT